MVNWTPQALKYELLYGTSSIECIALLAAVMACSVLIPITQYRILYGISVGYPASVLVVSLMLWHTFHPNPYTLQSLLTANAIFYGTRLMSYLLLRDMTGWKPKGYHTSTMSRAWRIPFAIALSILYALMVSPLWYVLRGTALTTKCQHWASATELLVGLVISCLGNAMEAIADLQKYIAKKNRSSEEFNGPVRGLFRVTRHPNYTGEVLFWVGLWLAGVPFYDKVGKIASFLGLMSIVLIMRDSTRRLEQRHSENYGGQKRFEQWRHDVPAPLFPFCNYY